MGSSEHRYLYGDRQLLLCNTNILEVQANAIVVPADPRLSRDGNLIAHIGEVAGERLAQEMQQLVSQYGTIDAGMALYTSAGELPFEAIIHAVVPAEDDPRLLQQAVSRALQLCEMNEWPVVAFYPLGSEADMAPERIAEALHLGITRFWDAREECQPHTVKLCLGAGQCEVFAGVVARHQAGDAYEPRAVPAAEPAVEESGLIELSDEDIEQLNDTDIDEWFK